MRKKRLPILDLVFISVFALLFWKPFVFNVSTSFSVAIPMEKNSFGIDVSHHQGKINWDTLLNNQSVRPTIDFVFLKATEGLDHRDKQYNYNSNELRKKDIPIGAYHFFLPLKSSRLQAKNFISTVRFEDIELPPVIDIEQHGSSKEALKDSVKVWLDLIEDNSGMRPLIYCSWSFYKKYFENDFSDYKFWVARYSNTVKLKEHPNILYWQFTDQADLPFHTSKIDLNVSSVKFD